MYAEADLYGLGKGVFPKDAAPVNPAHPHCLCHYAPVYRRELEGRKRSDNVEENGRAWLAKQPLHIRQAILGVKGEQEWKAGKGVKLGDLAAMTAATGVEFAVFTRKSERLVIRGSKNGVPGSIKELAELSRQGYRFSGHTHPGIGRNVLMASDGDYLALQQFHQKNSVIYNSQGQYQIYEKR